MDEARIAALEPSMSQLRGDLANVLSSLNQEKVEFKEALKLAFANQKIQLNDVVGGARREFTTIKATIDDLYVKTAQSIQCLEAQIQTMESSSIGSVGRAMKGYLQRKRSIPKSFSDEAEEWRLWQEEIEDYLDSVNPGMTELFEEIDKEEEPIDIA